MSWPRARGQSTLLILPDLGMEHLDRHLSPKAEVKATEHCPHPPHAQEGVDPVPFAYRLPEEGLKIGME
jgi:hypothetical protein